jgi:hypothetical protein
MATIAVIDLAHCGTTMVAGVLERLGVPMVLSRGRKDKLEDLDVYAALPDAGKFSNLVQRRGDLAWGFKCPGAWKYPGSLALLPDPVFVAIYKDPVSVTLRRFGTISGGKLAQTCRWMADNVRGINESGLPVHWLSYLEAVRKPGQFTAQLAQLAGTNVTGGQMDAILEWIFPAGGRNA